MSSKPRSKTPDPIVLDQTLEAQMKAAAEAPQTALVKTEDIRLEAIKHPQGDRNLARKANGKFARKKEALAQTQTNMVAEVLLSKVEGSEDTVHMAMIKNIADLCRNAKTDKAILGAVKALQQLEESSGITQSRENLLKQEDKGPQHLTVVFSGKEYLDIMQRDFEKLVSYVRSLEKRLNVPVEQQYVDASRPETAPIRTQPSFAAERPQPSFAEVESIRTNPRY